MGSDSSELTGCGNCSRILLIIINLLFIVVALAVLGVGIWLIVIGVDFTFITGSTIIGGAALLIVCSSVTLIICAVGIVGAMFKLRPLLVVYAIVVGVIVVLEIVAAILAFVYSDRVGQEITDQAHVAIGRYRTSEDNPEFDSSVNNAIDTIQNTFTCCGFESVSDWYMFNEDVAAERAPLPPAESCPMCSDPPEADCRNFTFIHRQLNESYTFMTRNRTCLAQFTDRIVVIGSAGGAVALIFGLLEILGVVLALGVCCCIFKAHEQTVV